MSFFTTKKLPITTTITTREYNLCRQHRWKYNYVFAQGIKLLEGNPALVERIKELEEDSAKAVNRIAGLMGRIRALEEQNAKKEVEKHGRN